MELQHPNTSDPESPSNQNQIPTSNGHSPPHTPTPLDHLNSQLQALLSGQVDVCKISNVNRKVYWQLEARAESYDPDGDLAERWNRIQADLHNGELIVKYNDHIGHTIMLDAFLKRLRDDPSFCSPRDIMSSRQDIPLTQGIIYPDYSLYEYKHNSSEETLFPSSFIPTVAWKVGYDETDIEAKLALDAARLICLSSLLVQLAITVNITYKEGVYPRELERVVWRHWELDTARSRRVHNPAANIILNDPMPLPQADQATPPSYEAYIKIRDHGTFQYIAHITESYQIYPPDETIPDLIPILHRHLYRDHDELDAEQPAFHMSMHTVRETIAVFDIIREASERGRDEDPDSPEAIARDEKNFERVMRRLQRMKDDTKDQIPGA